MVITKKTGHNDSQKNTKLSITIPFPYYINTTYLLFPTIYSFNNISLLSLRKTITPRPNRIPTRCTSVVTPECKISYQPGISHPWKQN